MRIRAFAAAASMAGLLTASTVLTAEAAQASQSDCPSQYLCAWVKDNWVGTNPGKVKDANDDLTGSVSFQNVHSLYNHGQHCDAEMYTGKSRHGVRHTLARGEGYPNLHNIPEFADGIASNYWFNCS